jgi:hypothetical protein
VNLHGWDTVSAVSVAALNDALAAGQSRLITSVEVDEPDVLVRGRLGPWRILPGVAGAFLNVELPIEQVVAARLPGAPGESDITGVSVVVQIALKLLPAADGRRRELRFDLSKDEPLGASAVTCTEVLDPQGRLPELARAVLGQAVSAAVAAHGDTVTYVFASIGGVETGAGWLDSSASDWCYVETVDGAAYLAILGVVGGRSDDEPARVVDPAALDGRPKALLAISESALLNGAVLPHLRQSWFKDMKPQFSGKAVVGTAAKRLPTQRSWPFYLTPYIDRLNVSVAGNALVSECRGHCDMSLGTRLDYTVTTTMPFSFDAASRKARFLPDKSPKATHTMHLPGVLDSLVGWFVRWIVSFFADQIDAPLQAVAGAVQSVSSPPVGVTGWLGVRFEVTHAELSTSLVFRDRSGR